MRLAEAVGNNVRSGLACICVPELFLSEAGKVQPQQLLLAAGWYFLCRLVETQLRME